MPKTFVRYNWNEIKQYFESEQREFFKKLDLREQYVAYEDREEER